MAKTGRPPVLNDTKKGMIVALLAVGCSQRAIAPYVGCARETIRRTMAREPKFAEKIREAKCSAEVGLLRNIRNAAKKEQHWRAAAWMLEHGYPRDHRGGGARGQVPPECPAAIGSIGKEGDGQAVFPRPPQPPRV
ncbi:MAG: hypothetical protein ABR915_15415 [Thermoguttaceae bacterium]